MGFAEPADLIGKTDLELLPAEIAQKFFDDEQKIIRTGRPMIDLEEYVYDSSGGKTWLLTTKVPVRNARGDIFGVAGVSRDITDRRLANLLRDGQAQILEMIAMSAPLAAILDALARLVESQLSGILCSVLLLDEDGRRLRHGAAPSLAPEYVKAIDGIEIGPSVGSCGAAALSSPAGDRHRHPRRPAVGRLSRTRQALRLSLLLVDADPFRPRRGAGGVRDVFAHRAGADLGRDAAAGDGDPHRRHRHRPPARRRAHPVHGHPRRADRPAQSRPVRRTAGGGAAVGGAARRMAVRRLHRLRQLQVRQRQPRPQRRRRAAQDHGRAHGRRRRPQRHRGAARRRRVRRAADRSAQGHADDRRHAASHPFGRRRAGGSGRPQLPHHVELRRGDLSHGRRDRRDPARQRRRRDVQRQGIGRRRPGVLRAGDQRQSARAPDAARRIAQRRSEPGFRSALSAAGRSAQRRSVRGRSADPLASPAARPGAAGEVHPDRRGIGADRADRRLGVARSLPAEQGVAGRRPAADRGQRQRLGASVPREPHRLPPSPRRSPRAGSNRNISSSN